jgi:PEP-CTERM motif
MRRFAWAALYAAAGLALAAPASAYVMVATFTGTVGPMTFTGGAAFAPAGVSLTGDPFTAVYVFDSDATGVVATPTSLDVKGGICCLNFAPISSALLTINGVTEQLGHDPSTQAFDSEIRYDAGAGTVFFQSGRNSGIDSNLIFNMIGTGIPLSLSTPFTLTQDAGSSFFRWQDFSFGIDRAQLIPTSLTVVRAVPEPATWAMMLLGFFGLGAALRRRHAVSRRGPAFL